MIRYQLNQIMLVTLCFFLVIFCHAQEKSTSPEVSDTLLCNSWIISSHLFHRPEGVRQANITESPTTITFNSDSTFVISVLNDIRGKWSYTKRSHTLTLMYDQQKEDFKILLISPKEILLKSTKDKQAKQKPERLVRLNYPNLA